MAFGKKDDDRTRAEKFGDALDPAFARRVWSAHDAGPAARMRDVQRQYEQIKLTEQLLYAQQETNRLLTRLLAEQDDDQQPGQ